MGNMGDMTVRLLIWPEEQDKLHALRGKMLRQGLPPSTRIFAADDLPTTRHFGAFDDQDNLIGCATLVETEDKDLQLRGMATDSDYQQSGVGRAVLTQAQNYALENGLPLWCNARLTAKGFYEKLGWVTEGEVFDVPHFGPHYVMRWQG
jgi:predicted GNAT family N-acyltransferase